MSDLDFAPEQAPDSDWFADNAPPAGSTPSSGRLFFSNELFGSSGDWFAENAPVGPYVAYNPGFFAAGADASPQSIADSSQAPTTPTQAKTTSSDWFTDNGPASHTGSLADTAGLLTNQPSWKEDWFAVNAPARDQGVIAGEDTSKASDQSGKKYRSGSGTSANPMAPANQRGPETKIQAQKEDWFERNAPPPALQVSGAAPPRNDQPAPTSGDQASDQNIGAIHKAWNWLWGIGSQYDHQGLVEQFQHAMENKTAEINRLADQGKLPPAVDAETGTYEVNDPAAQQATETFITGSLADAAKTWRAMASPGNVAVGAAAALVPPLRPIIGGYYAVRGGVDALTPRQPGEAIADEIQRRLGGAGTALLAAAGTWESLPRRPFIPNYAEWRDANFVKNEAGEFQGKSGGTYSEADLRAMHDALSQQLARTPLSALFSGAQKGIGDYPGWRDQNFVQRADGLWGRPPFRDAFTENQLRAMYDSHASIQASVAKGLAEIFDQAGKRINLADPNDLFVNLVDRDSIGPEAARFLTDLPGVGFTAYAQMRGANPPDYATWRDSNFTSGGDGTWVSRRGQAYTEPQLEHVHDWLTQVGDHPQISNMFVEQPAAGALVTLRRYGGSGGGHHVICKQLFDGILGYDSDESLAIPNDELRRLNIKHPEITPNQQRGYIKWAKDNAGKRLTWDDVEGIETQALIEVKMDPNMARYAVQRAIQSEIDRGVPEPANIPWIGENPR